MNRGEGKSRQAGFSLIELTVVVLIIAIGATLAFISVEGFSPSARLKAAVRTLASTINYTRNQAITIGEILYLEYDLRGNRYRVIVPFVQDMDGRRDEGETSIVEWEELGQGIQFEGLVLADGDVRQTEVVRIPFHPSGTTVGHIIYVQNQSEKTFSIEVNGLTGFVEFFNSRKELEGADVYDFEIE